MEKEVSSFILLRRNKIFESSLTLIRDFFSFDVPSFFFYEFPNLLILLHLFQNNLRQGPESNGRFTFIDLIISK